jgi:hypothetical protein
MIKRVVFWIVLMLFALTPVIRADDPVLEVTGDVVIDGKLKANEIDGIGSSGAISIPTIAINYLDLSGSLNFLPNAKFTGSIKFEDSAEFDANLDIEEDLFVGDDTTITGDLYVGGRTTMNGGFDAPFIGTNTIGGNLEISNNLQASSATIPSLNGVDEIYGKTGGYEENSTIYYGNLWLQKPEGGTLPVLKCDWAIVTDYLKTSSLDSTNLDLIYDIHVGRDSQFDGNVVIDGEVTIGDEVKFEEDVRFNGKIGARAYENNPLSGTVPLVMDAIYHGITTNDTAPLDLTLRDGITGQQKFIVFTLKDTNNMTLTPANFANGTSILFDTTGEFVHLIFVAGEWRVINTTATIN